MLRTTAVSCLLVGVSLVLMTPLAIAEPSRAPQAGSKGDKSKLELKDMGVPGIKETILTPKQAKAQQEEFKKLEKQMAKEAAERRATRKALAPVFAEFSKEGIKAKQRSQSGSWLLLAPSLAKLKDPKARKSQAASLSTRFKSKVEPILKKKVSVEVYDDLMARHRLN